MALNDRIKNKLSKIFDKYGVTEDDVKEILTTGQEAPADEIPAEPIPEEPKTEIDEGQPAEAETPAAEPAEEPQAIEPQVEEPQAAEAEQSPEQPIQEETPAVQEPLPDPRVDELEKAVEGLSSKLDAFIDSLRKAGVLVEAPEQVGIENQGFGNSNGEESLGDTLSRLNRGKTY